MPKFAIYTLTRDRVEYTAKCFEQLKKTAGMVYDHYVVDNGSQDETVRWLKAREGEFKQVIYNPENLGISVASNQALKMIFDSGEQYDLIVKMDNDCFVLSEKILQKVAEVYAGMGRFSGKYILSPRVELINNQPTRGGFAGFAHYTIGLTSIVGGLFHIVPAEIYREYQYPENLPKAKGQDDHFCNWFKIQGGQVGYIEELIVEHKDGTDVQAKNYPEYFERKWKEEKL